MSQPMARVKSGVRVPLAALGPVAVGLCATLLALALPPPRSPSPPRVWAMTPAREPAVATPSASLSDTTRRPVDQGLRPEPVAALLGSTPRSAKSDARASDPPVCRFRGAPRLAWVDESDAVARRVYRIWRKQQLPVPEIYKAMSLRPDLMERVADLTERAHFTDGALSRRTKELIATYVSSLNRCDYCLGSHSANLRELGANARQAAAVARQDLDASSLTPKERGLLAFVKRLTLDPSSVSDAQIGRLRRLGWRDAQIFEAAFETSLFAFFNRIAETYGLESPSDAWLSADRVTPPSHPERSRG